MANSRSIFITRDPFILDHFKFFLNSSLTDSAYVHATVRSGSIAR